MSDWFGSALGTGLLVCALMGIMVLLGVAVHVLDVCISWIIDRDGILADDDPRSDEEKKQ